MIKSKNGFYKNFLYLCLVAVISFGLMTVIGTGCSGGSSSSSGGGSTTKATVDEETVDETLGFITETVPGCSKRTTTARSTAAIASAKTVRSVIKIAEGLMDQVEFSYHTRTIRAVETGETEIDGSCDGTLTLNSSEDDVTGDFTASVDFDDFCQESDGTTVLVDGDIDVSGKIDIVTGDFTSIEAASDGISIEEGEESYTMTFDVSVTVNGDQTTINIPSFYVKDESTNETFTITNLTITATGGDTTTQVQMTGRFTHSVGGYVDITTTDPLVADSEGVVTSGELKFSGAGSTYVLFTATGDDNFDVKADTDGDGDIDYEECLDCSDFDVEI